jgi:hypothetical protein
MIYFYRATSTKHLYGRIFVTREEEFQLLAFWGSSNNDSNQAWANITMFQEPLLQLSHQ